MAYQRALKMNELAWDVYYVYERGREWTGDLPPVPDYCTNCAACRLSECSMVTN